MRCTTAFAIALLTLLHAQPGLAQRAPDRFPELPPRGVAEELLRPRDDAFAAIGRGMAVGGLGGVLLARGVCAMQLRDTDACGRTMVGSALFGVVVGGFVWPAIEERLERRGRGRDRSDHAGENR